MVAVLLTITSLMRSEPQDFNLAGTGPLPVATAVTGNFLEK
jgi:hypothetical protein